LEKRRKKGNLGRGRRAKEGVLYSFLAKKSNCKKKVR